jgi:hypothetical protein
MMHSTPERPTSLHGDLANLPDALAPLKEFPNWVCWKWEWRVDKKGIGKWTKPPYQPQRPDVKASVKDPSTWGSYDEALAAFKARKCDGIGLNLSGTDIAAFDIDECRDRATGEILPGAMKLVARANSYTEITPSGDGLRIIGTGSGDQVPSGPQPVPGSAMTVETYRKATRYITVTGNPLRNTPQRMGNLDPVIDTFTVAGLSDVKSSGSGNGKANGLDSEIDFDQWKALNSRRHERDDDFRDIDDRYLPPKLKALIANRPPANDLSAAFYRVVCWLHELKWSAQKIESYIREKPVMPIRYNGRLEEEIQRCLYNSDKRKAGKANEPKPSPTGGEGATISAQALGAMQFPEIKYVVPGLIVEGLTLLAGKPKIGKSWMLLHAAIAVASGGVTLGGIQCAEGDVLYCALEDNLRRLQSRLNKLLSAHQLLGADQEWPARLSFRCEMLRLAEGGLEQVRDWIKAANHPRLVIIDTLAMVRARKGRDESSYDADYSAVKELRDMANEYNVAIVIVHHLRKAAADDAFDTVSGTLGLTGAPDSILVLKYDTAGMVLHGKGRDLIELEKALCFDQGACTWTIKGDAAEVRRSTERNVILTALEGAGEALGPRQIAEAVGMKAANVRFLLNRLLNEGEVVKAGYGKYRRRKAPVAQEWVSAPEQGWTSAPGVSPTASRERESGKC